MPEGAIVPLAKQHEALFKFALEDFRDKLLFVFRIMTDGMPEQWRRHAFKIIKFFEEETTEQVWAELSVTPDPDAPGQSIAQSWLQEWERLAGAVGRKKDDGNTGASARDRAEPEPGY